MNHKNIDTLIAEKIMGWEVKGYNGYENPFVNKYNNFHESPFSPSTDIKDAWLVVEKLYISITPQQGAPKELSFHAEIDNQPLGNYYESFAENAPLAICLAALKSVGVEVEVDG